MTELEELKAKVEELKKEQEKTSFIIQHMVAGMITSSKFIVERMNEEEKNKLTH